MGTDVTFKVELVEGTLVVVSSLGEILPLSVLDEFRLTTNQNQIGRRFWDEKWDSWSYQIDTIDSGLDVTSFIQNL